MKRNKLMKLIIYLLTFILVFSNFILINAGNVEATTYFTEDYAPYNVKIVKVASYYIGGSNFPTKYMLDEEGNLWKNQRTKGISKEFEEYKFKDIACGTTHTIALDMDGHLWGWGSNKYYQLGNGTKNDSDSPIAIYPTKKFESIACSSIASFAIDKEGNLYAWGSNKFGETSFSSTTIESFTNSTKTNTIECQKTPTLKISNIEKISTNTNSNSILAIDKEGYLWGWGDNTYKQLGINNDGDTNTTNQYFDGLGNITYNYEKTPVKINEEIKFKDISVGCNHSIILSEIGEVYTNGRQLNGQLGNGESTSGSKTFVKPIGLEDIKINKILAGYLWSAFMDEEQNIWSCGLNTKGQLGNGSTTSSATIVGVKKNTDITFVDFATNSATDTAFVLDSEGNLWGWGDIDFNNLPGAVVNDRYAIATSRYVVEPVQITGVKTTHKVTFKNETEIVTEVEVEDGAAATAPEITKPGYSLTWDTDFSNVTEDLIVNAIWTANSDTAYTVEHYLRSLDKEVESYDLIEREPRTGTTDSLAVAIPKEYTGFTENKTYSGRVPNGTITADGNLVLKVYYNRNTYEITYELNGGTASTELISNYTYGEEMILQNKVTKDGYTFAGWYDNEELSGNPITKIGEEETGAKEYYAKWTTNTHNVTFKDEEDGKEETKQVTHGDPVTPPNWTKPGYEPTWDGDLDNITEDSVIKVIWVPRSDTAYKVEYYLRSTDLEVETYILQETVPQTGTTGTTVNAEIKEYPGFTENTTHEERLVSGTILGDGSLTLKVFYERNVYEVTLNPNGGTITSGNINSYTYGIEEILPTRVTKEGYVFVGWYDNEECTGTPVTKITGADSGEKAYYAKWVAEDEYYITSEVYSIDFENNYITRVSPNTDATTFRNNITTNGTMKVVNARGEEISTDALVGTGYKLQVTYKGIVHEYEIAVRGDVDGNGIVTVTDLSMVNQVIVKSLTLTGVKQIAADTDYNGEITVTDLSMVNQAITGKIKL